MPDIQFQMVDTAAADTQLAPDAVADKRSSADRRNFRNRLAAAAAAAAVAAAGPEQAAVEVASAVGHQSAVDCIDTIRAELRLDTVGFVQDIAADILDAWPVVADSDTVAGLVVADSRMVAESAAAARTLRHLVEVLADAVSDVAAEPAASAPSSIHQSLAA